MANIVSQIETINETLSNLNQQETYTDFIVQFKSLTEGVREISTVMLEENKKKKKSGEK